VRARFDTLGWQDFDKTLEFRTCSIRFNNLNKVKMKLKIFSRFCGARVCFISCTLLKIGPKKRSFREGFICQIAEQLIFQKKSLIFSKADRMPKHAVVYQPGSKSTVATLTTTCKHTKSVLPDPDPTSLS